MSPYGVTRPQWVNDSLHVSKKKKVPYSIWLCFRQEAILAAISEKDAHIAVLETSGTTKQNAPEVERLNKQKEKLQHQLKELVSGIFTKILKLSLAFDHLSMK